MDLRKIGIILLVSSFLISGTQKLMNPVDSADLLRKNVAEVSQFMRQANLIDINDKMITDHSQTLILVRLSKSHIL